MPNDRDIELLEAYLDDALSPALVERLDARLTAESELSAALVELRQERALRVAIFESQVPTTEQSDQFAQTVLRTIRQNDRRQRWIRGSRRAGAVAACLLVGFGMGWIGHGMNSPTIVTPPTHGHADVHLAAHAPKPAEPGQFQVAVMDDEGHVIAVQHFSKVEDARRFADDLGKYEIRRQQVQEGQAMLVSDQF